MPDPAFQPRPAVLSALTEAFHAKWGFREVVDHPFPVGAGDMTDLILDRELA